MQELLLFGQVPLARHDYVLSVLAGIAAMQPKPILEKHLLFKPSRPLASVRASSAIAAARQQGVPTSSQLQAPPGDLFYLKVVIDINDLTRSGAVAGPGPGTGAGAGAGAAAAAAAAAAEGTANFAVEINNNGWASNKDGGSKIPNPDFIGSTTTSKSRKTTPEEWTLQFRDLPEVNGRRTVTSRQMFDLDFKSGEALAFMSALDYSHTSCHIIAGHRLSHLSTSLLLYHDLANDSIAPSLVGSGLFPEHACLAPSSCPSDPLGAYILQASLMVQDVNKPELMTRGVNELMALKDMLKGVVDINVGDRLSLDTRVREHLGNFGSIR